MRKILAIIILLISNLAVFAQEAKVEEEYVHGLFRGTHVINGQSAETQNAGEMDFYIAHRFGTLNSGFYELFGLDNASMRMGFDYGIKDWLAVGIGRSTFGKEYDSMFKARILRQSNLMPLSLTWHSGLYINATAPNDNLPLEFQHRLAFSNQLLIARKFSDRFSVQIMPTHVHLNLVSTADEPNDIFSLGLAGKVQITKNIALTAEYYYTPSNFLLENTKRPLAIGIDINTGNHVFQIHFTNASGMQDKAILSNTTGNWANGDIQFGFNMVRTFKIKGTRY